MSLLYLFSALVSLCIVNKVGFSSTSSEVSTTRSSTRRKTVIQWINSIKKNGNTMDKLDQEKIHLFAGRAVKRERRKGSSRRQQPAYGAAVNEVARELLRSARSPKRENGGRRYIKHDGMIASPVGSCLCCWQLPLSPPVPPLYCSAPHCPSLSDQVWCIQRCDCVNCT